MKKNKFVFYVQHLFKMCFYNKVRFFLSVIGLFVGLFIFTTVNILIDSYYNESIKNAMQMDKDVVALRYGTLGILDKYDIYNNKFISSQEVVSSSGKSLIFAKKYTNDTLCTLAVNAIGVSQCDKIIPVQYNNGDFLFSKTELLKGRSINATDVALKSNVVVIDKFTEKLLFPDMKSIGKDITLNVQLPGTSTISKNKEEKAAIEKYTVIGVVDNSYSTLQSEMKYNKYISNATESIALYSVIYIPISNVKENFEIKTENLIAWSSEKAKELEDIKGFIANYKNSTLKEFSMFESFDRSIILSKAKEQLEPLRISLFLVMIFLLLISGINAMSTMFFSVKERINEIGIKKALGATKIEILNQFIIEGLMMSLIASMVTILISLVTVLFIEKYLNEKLFILFEIYITPSNLLLPVLVAIIYGFIFSIIPSYYGANIKITDSLRFE